MGEITPSLLDNEPISYAIKPTLVNVIKCNISVSTDVLASLPSLNL